jgi:hypothetical protein
MANFIYNAAAPPLIPTNLSIIQNPLPANGPGVELNTAVNLRNANWPEVPTGQVLPAGAMPGIFTVGQFQCMCIALAIFPNPAPPQWTQCHLAHVSHKNHAGIQNVINQLNAINHGQAYVVIGGKVSMKESMEFIRNRLGLFSG